MVQNNLHVLLFSLQNEFFGISVMNVLRVINLEKLIKIPKAPNYIVGAMNFESNVIPVIDLARKIDLGKTELDISSKVVILEINPGHDGIEVGIIIDQVLDVIPLDVSQLLPPPLDNMGFDTNSLDGMYKVVEQFYMILNASKIFEKELISLAH